MGYTLWEFNLNLHLNIDLDNYVCVSFEGLKKKLYVAQTVIYGALYASHVLGPVEVKSQEAPLVFIWLYALPISNKFSNVKIT